MNLHLKSLTAALLLSFGLQAQNASNTGSEVGRSCATPVPPQEWNNWFNQKVEDYKRDRALGKTQATNYTIPVIIHVIHGGQAVGTFPNISQTQINSQITVLNNDFAGTGFNVGNLAATAFSAIGAADCSIAFCLAQMDPNGNTLTEPGIERLNYSTNNWSNPTSFTTLTNFQNYIDGTIKPATIWDPTRYLNIWVSDVNSNVNILGYATFPTGTGLNGIFNGSGTATTDGVYIWARSLGNTGTLQYPYNRGRTATHEIGHWLGLRHIWGDGTCATDYCNDTPSQQTSNYGCPSYPANPSGCGSTNGDMFMNFMDYCDDACLYMFTPDQSARMTTAMNLGTFRSQLTASSVSLCNTASAIMPVSSFTAPATGCMDSLVIFGNVSTGTPSPSYSWSVSPVMPGIIYSPNNTAANPTIKFMTSATYTITLSATNAAGTSTSSSVIVISECAVITPSTDVGIQNNQLLDKYVTLSPNPTSGLLNIKTSLSGRQDLEVSIHNYLGQFITSASYKDAAANTYQLDLGSYANGVYFVTVSTGQQKSVKRLIINK